MTSVHGVKLADASHSSTLLCRPASTAMDVRRLPLGQHIDNRRNAFAPFAAARASKTDWSSDSCAPGDTSGSACGDGDDEQAAAVWTGDAHGATGRVPDEVVERILAHVGKAMLARCMLVCRRWFRLCTGHRLWRRLDLASRKIDERSVHVLLSRGIVFMRCANTEVMRNPLQLPMPTDVCRLTFLDLSMLSTNDVSTVTSLLRRCVNLRMLSVEQLRLEPAAFAAIGRNKSLLRLNMALAQGLGRQQIRHIVDSCKQLQELNVAWTDMEGDGVAYLCRNCPTGMLRLNLAGAKETLRDQDVQAVVSRCGAALTEFDMSDCGEVTRAGFVALLACAQLCVVHASRCYTIEPIVFLEAGCLSELIIHGCVTDEGHRVLAEHLGDTRLNTVYFSTVARPTVGERRTSIWTHRVREYSTTDTQ